MFFCHEIATKIAIKTNSWVYVKYGPLNRPIKVRVLTDRANTIKLLYLIVTQWYILWIFINVMHADHKRACHWVRRKTAVCAVYSHCVFCILLVIQSRLLKSDFSRWRFNSKKVKKTRSTTVGKKREKYKWWIFIVNRLPINRLLWRK